MAATIAGVDGGYGEGDEGGVRVMWWCSVGNEENGGDVDGGVKPCTSTSGSQPSGKALADDVVTSHSIALEMLIVDVKPLNLRLLNNRSAHSDYLKHTQEEAVILREIVKQGKSKNPLNAYLDYACKYTK
nr:hypothetical protein [Tanacetum cinerariifolium]